MPEKVEIVPRFYLKTSRGFMLVSVLLPLTENVQFPDVLLNIFSGFMLTNVETLS